MDLPTGDELQPFSPTTLGHARPQGVAVIGHKAYVTLSNLDEGWAPAGPGWVLVVDVAAWTADKLVELPKTNPSSIHRPYSGGKKLYVPCSESFLGTGGVVVLDTADDSIACTAETGGAPGKTWVDAEGTGWAGDQLDGQIFKYDAGTCQVLDTLMVCPSDFDNGIYELISALGTDGRGNVCAGCFATDTVHIFPAATPTDKRVVEVGDGPVDILVIQR
jgi:hypothetical protein